MGDDAMLGDEGRGLDCAQLFVHENRIRQAASSLGAAQFCIDASIAYAKERMMFGKPLADYQGIQWQLVELQTDAELLRNTILKTAWQMDQAADGASTEAKISVSPQVSMVNYRSNQLACRAADRAIQVHGGVGYSRHKPFEHIYRHHRRYRITEGSDELQLRRIANQPVRLLAREGRTVAGAVVGSSTVAWISDPAALQRRSPMPASRRSMASLRPSMRATKRATPSSRARSASAAIKAVPMPLAWKSSMTAMAISASEPSSRTNLATPTMSSPSTAASAT